ncbi:MAG TPA: PAS domain S-box protein, partial [Isosphaeraceae bacterium]
MAEPTPIDILVIEDEADARANLRDILELDDHRVETAGTAAEALRRDDWERFSVVILDRKLPDASAEELLPRIQRRAPDAAVIVVTGYSDLQGAIAALRHGAADYILKPLNADALRATLHRLAEARRLARAKERSDATFRHLVEAAECLIVILRPDAAIHYFSPFAERLTGYAAAEVLGRDFTSLLPEDSDRQALRTDLRRVLAGRPTRGFEQAILGRDGSRRWIIWNARGIPDFDEDGAAVLAVGQDITEIKQAQERALQAERLAAVGEMVAGLAHESRNALQRSQACLEMLALRVKDRPEAIDLIARLQSAQDHLHHLYEEVRGYAAPIRLSTRDCHLGEVLERTWDHLAVARRGRVAHLLQEADGLPAPGPRCEVDPFAIEQVFRNVLENALAACADPVEIRARWAVDRLGGQPAVRLALRDNGPGLAPEAARRIFEPFFT